MSFVYNSLGLDGLFIPDWIGFFCMTDCYKCIILNCMILLLLLLLLLSGRKLSRERMTTEVGGYTPYSANPTEILGLHSDTTCILLHLTIYSSILLLFCSSVN